MLDAVVSSLIPLSLVGGYVLLFRRFTRKITLDGIIEFANFARGSLVLVYMFVVAVVGVAHLLCFDVGVDRSLFNLLLLFFVALPAFLGFCYFLCVIQINLMLNSVLVRYHRKNSTCTSPQVCMRIRKMIRAWSLLHRSLFLFRKAVMSDVVDQVCPVDTDRK